MHIIIHFYFIHCFVSHFADRISFSILFSPLFPSSLPLLCSCFPTSHPLFPFTPLSSHPFITPFLFLSVSFSPSLFFITICLLTSFHIFLHLSLLGPGLETFLTWTYLLCKTAMVTAAPASLYLQQKSVTGCLTAFLQAQGPLRLICSTSNFVQNETHLLGLV